jgi:ribosome-associated protein
MTDVASVDALTLAHAAAAAAADKKAENILVLDLKNLSTVADYFVICSGGSERQLRAIAEGIDDSLGKAHRISPKSITGISGGGWVLLDFTDVIVHVFLPSQRNYYNLEMLWQQAPILLHMQ